MSFHKVNPFILNSGKDSRFLFFDIFCKNNELILICPVYFSRDNYWKDIEISIVDDVCEIGGGRIFKKIEKEPSVVVVYDLRGCNDWVKVDVVFKGERRRFTLSHMKTVKSGFLSHTTLCKEDYSLFDMFRNYYLGQGVEYFYIYYNGVIGEEVRDYFKKYTDVLLVEWNFPYWNNGCEFKHHAQMGQMHHALYKYGKNVREYMMFNDFDEVMHIQGDKTLVENMKMREYETFAFNHVWSSTLDGKIPKEIPTRFYVGNLNEYVYAIKSKCIHKTDRVLTMGIHIGKQYNMKNRQIVSNGCYMFHFRHWTHLAGNVRVDGGAVYSL